MIRKCSLCCTSKWLFPEETALACVCLFYQKVPRRSYLFIHCSFSSELGLSFFRPFFVLVLPSELCTTHGYTALSINTSQQWTTELLQLTHQNIKSQLSYSPLIANLLWKWWWNPYFQLKFTFYWTVSFSILKLCKGHNTQQITDGLQWSGLSHLVGAHLVEM